MQEYKIKVGKNNFFNSFQENKAKKDYECYSCKQIIPKGSSKYYTREGNCHKTCTKLYKVEYYKWLREYHPEYETSLRKRMVLVY